MLASDTPGCISGSDFNGSRAGLAAIFLQSFALVFTFWQDVLTKPSSDHFLPQLKSDKGFAPVAHTGCVPSEGCLGVYSRDSLRFAEFDIYWSMPPHTSTSFSEFKKACASSQAFFVSRPVMNGLANTPKIMN